MPWLQPTDMPHASTRPTAKDQAQGMPWAQGAATGTSSLHARSSAGEMARVLHWLPVAVALMFLAQIALYGFSPALAEARRLDAAEARLVDNFDSELELQIQLERTARARQDPIYLERERRSRLSALGASNPRQ